MLRVTLSLCLGGLLSGCAGVRMSGDFSERIDALSRHAKVGVLEEEKKGALKSVRAWSFFENDVIGYVLNNEGGRFTGLGIHYAPTWPFGCCTISEMKPKAGWEKLWRAVVAEGAFDLAKSTPARNNKDIAVDLPYVILEVLANGEYGRLEVPPSYSPESVEAKRMSRIFTLMSQSVPKEF